MNWRIRIFGARLLHYIFRWPFRVWRLLLWMLWIKSPRGKHRVYRWCCGLFLLVFDLTPLSIIYVTISDLIRKNARTLTDEEKSIARTVYGQCVPLHLISLNPDSIPVKKKKASAYVSFHIINFFRELPSYLLIHELMHVWQYERYGSVYISEAIWAQRWGGGYNYGGLEPLMKYSEGKGLGAFNFEQQADIIEDYYRWKNGMPLQWALNVPGIGEVLEKYKSELCKTVRQ
jgi:hypothetical protein